MVIGAKCWTIKIVMLRRSVTDMTNIEMDNLFSEKDIYEDLFITKNLAGTPINYAMTENHFGWYDHVSCD